MGLISFMRDAGEKLFGTGSASAGTAVSKPSSGTGPAGAGPAGAAGGVGSSASAGAGAAGGAAASDPNEVAARAIENYIASMQLAAKNLRVSFDGASGTATVSGEAPDQATREKIVLCCGNVAGVAKVDDRMTVARSEPEARLYTVVSGDTLSKIAKEHYGDANAYMTIFEANKPMLKHPDKIYPGQVLRIPPKQ